MKARATLFLTVVSCALLTTAPALACPYCAGRDGENTAVLVALWSMILLPFCVVVGVIPFIRRAAQGNPVPTPMSIHGDHAGEKHS